MFSIVLTRNSGKIGANIGFRAGECDDERGSVGGTSMKVNLLEADLFE